MRRRLVVRERNTASVASVFLAAAVALVLLIAQASRAHAAETPIPPSPTRWVTDTASVLTPATRDALDERLAAYNRATGHQVIVWTGTTTGDAPLEDWTIRAFTAWHVGRKKLDDGLALFVFTQDRKARIEVGYGLEGIVTDATASSIIRNQIAPRMKAGDPDGAITAGVSSLLAVIGGEQGAQAGQTPEPIESSSDTGTFPFWILILFVIIFIIAVRKARHGGYYTIGSGGWSSGGGWGGSSSGGFGGFSGGGGMGGGGGASGGW
jgi:uncharacterized protein